MASSLPEKSSDAAKDAAWTKQAYHKDGHNAHSLSKMRKIELQPRRLALSLSQEILGVNGITAVDFIHSSRLDCALNEYASIWYDRAGKVLFA